jgi:hypothetical protein
MDCWWLDKIPLDLLLANEAGPMPVLVQCKFSSSWLVWTRCIMHPSSSDLAIYMKKVS